MVLRKFRFASSRWSAGEATLGELGSLLWERPESPLVNKLGRAAIVCLETGEAGGEVLAENAFFEKVDGDDACGSSECGSTRGRTGRQADGYECTR